MNLYKYGSTSHTRKGYSYSWSSEAVFVEIADTGTGVPDDGNLFEFSTVVVQGMGFGLMVVQQIIAAHEGSISYTSIVGKETTVRIELPLSLSKDLYVSEARDQ